MKRYLLFCFDRYYPGGGWDDYQGSFDSAQSATEWVEENWYLSDGIRNFELYQIVDSKTMSIIERGRTPDQD